MKEFRIPLVWQMYGFVWVEAETKEEAIKEALAAETPLPEGYYVDDSLIVDNECPIEKETIYETEE